MLERELRGALVKKALIRMRELSAFLFLTVVLAPAVTLAIVGGYGFAVWMYQILASPPGLS
jgi:nitrate reductase NapE